MSNQQNTRIGLIVPTLFSVFCFLSSAEAEENLFEMNKARDTMCHCYCNDSYFGGWIPDSQPDNCAKARELLLCRPYQKPFKVPRPDTLSDGSDCYKVEANSELVAVGVLQRRELDDTDFIDDVRTGNRVLIRSKDADAQLLLHELRGQFVIIGGSYNISEPVLLEITYNPENPGIR